MKRSVKIMVQNDFPEPVTLWLEPWGADFGMMPKDEFEIIAENADEEFYFHVVFNKDFVRVYAEGQSDYPRIFQNGIELEIGRNRFWDKAENES
jgi:hypothetical protein